MTIASPPPSTFTVFNRSDSDGTDSVSACDGRRHVEFFDGTACRVEPCNGACSTERRHVDLNDFITKSGRESLSISRRTSLGSQTKFSAAMRELVETGDPLVGVKFRTWYAKRCGQGMHVCLGDVHVTVHTTFAWFDGHGGKRARVYNIHSLKASPCDGTCTCTIDATPELLAKIAELERDEW